MKLLNVIIAVLLCSFLFTSCLKDGRCLDGNERIKTKTLYVQSFTGIDFAIAGDVNITQGNVQKVSVTGDQNIIDKIDNDVYGEVWDIDFGRDCFDHYELTVNITTPNIEEVYLSGSGNITLKDFSNQEDLTLQISGSGRIIINEFTGCEELSVKISGSGDIKANSDFSDLKELDIRISGSGDYDGFPISTNECDISISGSGNCEVFVRDYLDVNISGSGNVYYEGNPSLSTDINGSGNVVDAN